MALAEIPHPAGWPLVGNISDIDPVVPILSLNNLADQYGKTLTVSLSAQLFIFSTHITSSSPFVALWKHGPKLTCSGPIYSLNIFGKKRVIISSVALLNEVCNEQRFDKCVAAALEQVRNGTVSSGILNH